MPYLTYNVDPGEGNWGVPTERREIRLRAALLAQQTGMEVKISIPDAGTTPESRIVAVQGPGWIPDACGNIRLATADDPSYTVHLTMDEVETTAWYDSKIYGNARRFILRTPNGGRCISRDGEYRYLSDALKGMRGEGLFVSMWRDDLGRYEDSSSEADLP